MTVVPYYPLGDDQLLTIPVGLMRLEGERLLSVRLMPYPANSEEVHNVLFVAEDITETIRRDRESH